MCAITDGNSNPERLSKLSSVADEANSHSSTLILTFIEFSRSSRLMRKNTAYELPRQGQSIKVTPVYA